MRILHCQLPPNVIFKLYYSWCIPMWLMLYWHGEDWDVLMQLRLGVLTGEHVNYSQIITKRSSLHSIYDYFALLKVFNTNSLNFHQYLTDKLSSHQPSHMHNTGHRTNSNFNTPLFNHSKTQKCYLYQVIPIWNSLPNLLKNCISKFTFWKQIKRHLLASQS